MSPTRTHLSLVPTGLKRIALREVLIAQAKNLFPHKQRMADKWVEAKMILGNAGPKVPIGDPTVLQITFARTRCEFAHKKG